MRRFSVPARFGLATLGLLIAVVGLVIVGNATSSPQSFSPRDRARGSVQPGRRARLVGTVVSSDRESMVLSPSGAPTPTVQVTLADSAVGRATFSPGVVVGLDGLVTGTRGLVQATVVFPSGPSKYRSPP
jgi:hypothetical protein